MQIDVVLEPEAEEMEFAIVNRWYKQEGDEVTESDPLVEIEAEKASYDIPAPATGVLKQILAVAGDEVSVGARLATIEAA